MQYTDIVRPVVTRKWVLLAAGLLVLLVAIVVPLTVLGSSGTTRIDSGGVGTNLGKVSHFPGGPGGPQDPFHRGN